MESSCPALSQTVASAFSGIELEPVSRAASPTHSPPPPAVVTLTPPTKLPVGCGAGQRSAGCVCCATADNPQWPEQPG